MVAGVKFFHVSDNLGQLDEVPLPDSEYPRNADHAWLLREAPINAGIDGTLVIDIFKHVAERSVLKDLQHPGVCDVPCIEAAAIYFPRKPMRADDEHSTKVYDKQGN